MMIPPVSSPSDRSQPAARRGESGRAPTVGESVSNEAINAVSLVQFLVLAALVVAVFWEPIRSSLVYRWMHSGTWSYGWLVPLFSVYFLSTQRQRLAVTVRRPSYAGLLLLLVSLACYLLTLWVYRYGYPRNLTLLGVVAGLTLFLCGWRALRIVWFPIFFLVFAIPLPQSIYVILTMPLQKLAAHSAASVLAAMPDVQTEVSGVMIDYFYGNVAGHLNVEEACSGMRSMMAIVTLGVAMAYLGDRPAWHRVVLVLTCVPIAIFCNIIRVTTTGVLHVFEDSPVGRALRFEWWTGATPHALLGLATFALALVLFGLVGWVLSNLYVEDPAPGLEGGAPS